MTTRRPTRSGVRRAVAAVVLAWIALATLAPAAAQAHAELVSSTPADGVELVSSPDRIMLVFNERPELGTLAVRLFDRNGNERAAGTPTIDPAKPTTVEVAVPDLLQPGPYTVVYATVSEEDEHPEGSQFVFGLQAAAGAPSVTAAQLGVETVGWGQTLSVLLSLVGVTLLLGATFQRAFFGIRSGRLSVIALVGAGVSAVVLALPLLAGRRSGVAQVSSGGLLDDIDPLLVARVALLALVFVALVLTNKRTDGGRRPWVLAAGCAVALVWTDAMRSHATGVGLLPWIGLIWGNVDAAIQSPDLYGRFGTLLELGRQLNVAVATLHVAAVGAWMGGLVVVALLRLPAPELAAWQPRFSRFALWALVAVALTGLYQAVLYLPSPDALVGSDYGRVLVTKHLFVVGVLAVAGIQRFLVSPALRGARWARAWTGRVRGLVALEAMIGVGVIMVSAGLGTTATARPPSAIFRDQAVVAQFGDRAPALAGDAPGYALVVTRASETVHAFRLTGPPSQGAPSETADLTLVHQRPDATRSVPLVRSGDGWTGQGLVLTYDGAWTATASLPEAVPVRFRFDVGAGSILARDDEASARWDAAIAATVAGMRSARMIDMLTDGSSLMLFASHEFVAPERERYDLIGKWQSVTVGAQRHARQEGASAWTVQTSTAFVWPDFRFLKNAVGIRTEGTASQDGEACAVLVGYQPDVDVTYELWVGEEDGLIHRIVMGVPGHWMINAYYDLNAAISIEPPTEVVGVAGR